MKAVSQIDSTKKIYVIVHGQHSMLEPVKEKLASAGFSKANMEMASLDRAGNAGEYVAMLWPPMAASSIMVSLITGPAEPGKSHGMGAWGTVGTREVMRLPL